MNKFNFKNFDISKTLEGPFSADKNYNEPSNELETRKQLSQPLREIEEWLNSELFEGDISVFDNLLIAGTGIEIKKVGKRFEISSVYTPTGEVTKEYVDNHDALTLESANNYTDEHMFNVKEGKTSTITVGENRTIKVNQLVIDELKIENAPVHELEQPEWFDDDGIYTKYIDVAIEDVVESAKVDHWVMSSYFNSICGWMKCVNGGIRFLLNKNITVTNISATIKELIIQYQDKED